MKLRPHHGMCIRFFEGRGYSDEFTANMSLVVSRLQAEDEQIELTLYSDVICSACPNNNNGVCSDFDKVSRYDNAVLDFAKLHDGDTLSWTEFSETVRSGIISAGRLADICGDCRWYDICGGGGN